MSYIEGAKQNGISERCICRLIGIQPKTPQNWRREGLKDRRKGSARHVPHRLSPEEEQEFYDIANSAEFSDRTPEQIVATLATRGIYQASASSLYRILRKRGALRHRRESKKPSRATSPQRIQISGPNQIWSWDITWLRTDVQGVFLYAYTIIDLFDRSIVGWSIETNESDEHAQKLFARIIRDLSVVPEIVHADNGNPMRGMTLAVFLDSLQVSRSYSRPRCSNDNAHIESWHKTLKYTVGYPSVFTSLEKARMWYADFINWYNTEHQHSALGYVTPMQRRSGDALTIYAHRNETLQKAFMKNPLRWRQKKVRLYQSLQVFAFYRPVKKVA
jgi:transposase InsO family protein